MQFLKLLADVVVSSGGKLDNKDTLPTLSATEIVTNILNTAYFLAGIVAVGMIIFAGIQYLTANGEQKKKKKAMDTIIFSVVGLIIVIAAFAITKFVVDNVGK